MQITASRYELLQAFSLASSVIKSNSTKEILRNVKAIAAGDTLVLMGSDSEVNIRVEVVGVTVKQPGEALLLVPEVRQALSVFDGDDFHIEASETAIVYRSGNDEITLGSANPKEYPTVRPPQPEQYFEMSGKAVRDAIARTVPCIDVNSSRFALGGVPFFVHPEDGKVICVGTDGKRLSKFESAATIVGIDQEIAPIVPPKSLAVIAKAVDDDEQVRFSMVNNDLVVQCRACSIVTRTIEGKFPNWQQVVPKWITQSTPTEVQVGQLTASIQKAAIVSEIESRGINFEFNPGTLRLQAATAAKGKSKIETPIMYTGKSLDLRLDGKLMQDFLGTLDRGSNVDLFVRDSDSACVLKTSDGSIYVLMPMALSA